MVRFRPNQPVTTRDPRIIVDPGLPEGLHRFQLVVTDALGRQSKPAEIVVQVVSN